MRHEQMIANQTEMNQIDLARSLGEVVDEKRYAELVEIDRQYDKELAARGWKTSPTGSYRSEWEAREGREGAE